MKKLFTLILAVAGIFAAKAAAPELLFQGNPVEAGKTYETGYTKLVVPLGPFDMISYKQNSDLTLKGIKGKSVTVEVDASESVAVCSITGTCEQAAKITKTGELGKSDVVATDGNTVTVDLRIDKEYTDMTGGDPANILHTITVKVTAYYTDTPSDKVSTTVVLTTKSAEDLGGINGVVSDSQLVSFAAGNTLNYNVAKPTKVCIYNMAGNLVMSRTVLSQGSISLDSLHPGVYIYTAGKQAGKVIVRK